MAENLPCISRPFKPVLEGTSNQTLEETSNQTIEDTSNQTKAGTSNQTVEGTSNQTYDSAAHAGTQLNQVSYFHYCMHLFFPNCLNPCHAE